MTFESNLSGSSVNGQFNLDVDSSGRWSVEKFKGLMFHIERNSTLSQDKQEEEKVTLSLFV